MNPLTPVRSATRAHASSRSPRPSERDPPAPRKAPVDFSQPQRAPARPPRMKVQTIHIAPDDYIVRITEGPTLRARLRGHPAWILDRLGDLGVIASPPLSDGCAAYVGPQAVTATRPPATEPTRPESHRRQHRGDPLERGSCSRRCALCRTPDRTVAPLRCSLAQSLLSVSTCRTRGSPTKRMHFSAAARTFGRSLVKTRSSSACAARAASS